MQKALHIKTQVLPGNKIEIEAPELTEGDTVDIFVITKPKPEFKSAIDILDQLPDKKLI